MKSILRHILVTLIMAVVIFVLIRTTVQSAVVTGTSMEPSFQDGQWLIVNKVVYKFSEPERGDVITLHPPINLQGDFIKRIIGLPGETVEIREGTVYIDDAPLDESSYIKALPSYTLPRLQVPEGYYFVLGDNRIISYDSHIWGTLPREDIIGKAWLSVWPPNEWGVVPDYSPTE